MVIEFSLISLINISLSKLYMKKLLRIFVVLVLCYTNLQVVMANATGEGIGKLHPRLNGVSNLFATPGAPTNLVVTPINTGGMIQFTAPDDGGSAITNYEYSTDNGATWVTPSPAVTSSPLIISSGLTNCTSYQVKIRAVNAVGSGTASIAATLVPSTSNIGVNWTSTTSAADNFWRGVTYGNGKFVAVAYCGSGNRVMTSPDGITWTARNAAAENQWASVTYGNGLFVAVAIDGTGNGVMTSPDGITWTARTSAADNFWISVTYGNGVFVAVSIFSAQLMTSGYSVVADAPVISSAPVSQSEATVSFTQSTPALAPAITNYRYSIDNGSNWTTLSPASTTSPITITGLTDFSNQIQLQAINSVGNSCPASYSLSLVAVNLNKSGQKSSSPSEFVNKNGARGISGIRATGESRTNTPLLSATAAVTSITATTATSGGTVGADGGASVTARGVCWSTTTNPTITNSKTTDGTGTGTFTSAITGLTSGTTYYVRSYATNSVGTTYGPEVIFRTL